MNKNIVIDTYFEDEKVAWLNIL